MARRSALGVVSRLLVGGILGSLVACGSSEPPAGAPSSGAGAPSPTAAASGARRSPPVPDRSVAPPPATPTPPAPTATAELADPESIHFTELKADMGRVGEGTVAKHLFVFENQGSKDLVIKNIRTSCGCTVPELYVYGENEAIVRRISVPGKASRTPEGPEATADLPALEAGQIGRLVSLPPGARAGVLAQIHTQGLPTGPKHATVTVESNDPKLGTVSLAAQCQIVRLVDVNPPTLHFGQMARRDTKKMETLIAPAEDMDLQVQAPQDVPSFVHVTLDPVVDAEIQGTWRVGVTFGPGAPIGFFTQSLSFPTNHPEKPEVKIPIIAQVTANVVFEPERFFFQGVPKGEEREQTVRVVALDPDESFEITDVSIDTRYDGTFTPSVETVKEGREYVVHLKVVGDVEAPYFSGTVRLKTTHPDLPEKELTFYGYLQ